MNIQETFDELLIKVNNECKKRLEVTDKYYRRDLDSLLTQEQRVEIDEYSMELRDISKVMKAKFAETGTIPGPVFPVKPDWIK